MGSLRSLRKTHAEPVIVPKPSDREVYDAARHPGNPTQMQDLLTRGGNPNAVDDSLGESALQAAAPGRIGVIRLLLDHGVNLEHRNSWGWTALHYAATGGRKRSLTATRLLLDHGADINAVSYEGWSPLMLAVEYRQKVELVRLLLARGADPTLRNRDGNRAIDLIRPGESEAALKSLLEPVS